MENTSTLRKWLDDMDLPHPLVIAGPCSAETEEQVMEIAHALKDTDVNYYRAGIWKPRTRPGNFEGVGAIGLKWLQRVKEETGLKTATEVANRAHVDLALEHDVQIELRRIGAQMTRGEGADERSLSVREEELVAGPLRHHQLVGPRRRDE